MSKVPYWNGLDQTNHRILSSWKWGFEDNPIVGDKYPDTDKEKIPEDYYDWEEWEEPEEDEYEY